MADFNETTQLGDTFKPIVIYAKSEKTGSTLQLSVWGGRLFFTVFGKTSTGNLFRKSIDFSQLMVLESALADLIRMPAESTQSLTFSSRNQDTHKLEPDFQLNLLKDQRQVYMIELKGMDNNKNEFSDRFSSFLRGDVVRNAEPFKPAESSSFAIKGLRHYLTMVCPTEMSLTGRKNTPSNQNNSGKSGGRSFNNYKGKPQTSSPKDSGNYGNTMPSFENGTTGGDSVDSEMPF